MLDKKDYNELVATIKAVFKVDCFGVADLIRIHELKCNASDRQIFDAYVDAGVEQELTGRDLDIQDNTDGAIHQMLETLVGTELEWDIALVGDVRDSVLARLTRETGRSEYSFHPYMVTFEDQPPTTLQSIRNALAQQFRNEPHVLMEFESLLDIVITDGDFETEQDAINHLIDVTGDQAYNWRLFRTLCGARG